MSKTRRITAERFWCMASLMVFVILALDLVSKFYFWRVWLRGARELWRWWFFHLTVQLNTGIAFSIPLAGVALAVVLAVVLLALIWFVCHHVCLDNWWSLIAVGLLFGGAVGNLLTRLYIGAVVDFIGVGSFPLFNVADSAITISGIMLVLFWSRITH